MRIPYEGSSFLFIKRNDGREIRSYSSTPDSTGSVSGLSVDDKFCTHQLLLEAGLPVQDSFLVHDDVPEEVLDMLQDGVVVKPVDASHGNGITTHVFSQEDLRSAIQIAQEFNLSARAVIVQKMYHNPIDLRLLCIGDVFVAATLRLPASVKGDGVHTVAELIDIENHTFRGLPYEAKLARIDPESCGRFLGSRLGCIPERGEKFVVSGKANYGAGGEVIDISDEIPAWLVQYAENAAKTIGTHVSGVDFLVRTLPSKDHSPEDLLPVITELNKCPSFIIHEEPTSGVARKVTSAYVDYLSTL